MSAPKLRAGVIGWPIAHSRSPRLHGYWLRHYKIAGSYEALAVTPDQLRQFIADLGARGYRGVNVTLPHKEAVAGLMDELEPSARRIGAVNTIVLRDDRRLVGSNTDGFGFIENLKMGAPGFAASAGPAVVLGAGGAARAVVVALLDDGAPELRLVNRDRRRAEILAKSVEGPIRVFDWTDRARALADAAVLVNTTSLGMTGQPALELDLEPLPPSALVNDIVYAPLVTDLLRRANARGHKVVDGLGMLLHQGRPGFHAWFGVDPAVTPELRQAVLSDG